MNRYLALAVLLGFISGAVVLASSFSAVTYREAIRRVVIGAILMLLSVAVIIATSIHEA